ncbi:isocitrate/isopropylmalate dehydrogenase family protein [Streptomyces violaceusniger]|uniref:Isocitrate/isopropylmalate dehydrogenase n=1 Tax=Streptomyces violaceusniger (strain Tu 4113) TaxID=653045 RepID=G2PH05_STRV4|nr:isocitrate/isopropylmalate dehydrogenase family protein [Streptomyces violaceusniger]AEM88579.1 isocitrate/isopropylmalate dehydrogenase [Streptomyces violaceusniger Tu 4113]
MTKTVTVIPGDGIGPEVTREALETVDALGLDLRFDLLDHVNADTYLRTGVSLSDEDFGRVKASDAVLFGAIGDPRVKTSDYGRGVLLRLRFELDLFVNHRPATLLHEDLSPLRDARAGAIDCVIVRENTEGLYADIGGVLRENTEHETAVDADVSTYMGVSRVMEYAYSIARRGVCMVDKSNAVRHGGKIWQRVFKKAASRNPIIRSTHLYVDTAAMKLISDPSQFDVIVTNNSYGDILSDLAAVLAGGLGNAGSANINPVTGFGLYEPVHGSAPDIAGRGIGNPFGAILSYALMLENFGWTAEASALRRAVGTAISERRVTADLGGSLGTKEVGEAVRSALSAR